MTLVISESVISPMIEAFPSQRTFQGSTLISENNSKEDPITNESSQWRVMDSYSRQGIGAGSREMRPKYPEF